MTEKRDAAIESMLFSTSNNGYSMGLMEYGEKQNKHDKWQ